MKDNLILDFQDEARAPQDIGHLQISGEEMLHVLSLFDPYGMWRMELDTGLVYWSDDVYRIHGMERQDTPVDLKQAMEAYHPEDRPYVTQVLEEAVERKSGFRLVLRLKRPGGGYKLVKSTGKYRELADGTREIFGTFSEFQSASRAIATYG